MDCYEFKSLLSDFCDGEMPAKSRKLFNQHRDDCPDCDKLLAEFTKAVGAIQSLPKLHTSEDFNERLRERINREVPVSIWERLQDFVIGSVVPRYVIATALILGGMLFGVRYFGQDANPLQPESPAMNAPSLNVQDQQVQSPDVPNGVAAGVDSQDSTQPESPVKTRSFEDKIRYVRGD